MTEINRTTGTPVLDDILDEYAAAGPSREELERWIREYPQFRQELTELTVSWLELKHLPAVDATTDAVTAQLRAASILGEVLHTLGSASAPAVESKEAPVSPAPPSIDSLLSQAGRQGLDIEQLATLVKMSVTMIMSLHRRLVIAASIPQEALSALGGVLKLQSEALFAYLDSSPQIATGQQFKSKQAPKITAKMDFAELVKSDPELSDADRTHWLSIQGSSITRRQT